MDRVAVFVDAGYLFAQGSVLLTGQKQTRGDLILDYLKVVESLGEFATTLTGFPLLRIYWYDGTSTGPTSQHIALAYLPNLKVRLGFVNTVGQQKGVDSLIVTDMIALARNRAMSDAVLLSGDEDLRVGVQQAQEFGVRVHLLGIQPSRGSQSVFLLQEADTTHEWKDVNLKPFLQYSPRPTTQVPATPLAPAAVNQTPAPPQGVDARLEELSKEMASLVPEAELGTLVATIKATTQIPPQFDRPMLARARAVTGSDLLPAGKRKVRQLFLSACETRQAEIGAKT